MKAGLDHLNCVFWLFCAICVFFKEVNTKGSEASRLNQETKVEQRDETDDASSGDLCLISTNLTRSGFNDWDPRKFNYNHEKLLVQIYIFLCVLDA